MDKTAARGSFKKKQNYRLVKTILNRERWGKFLKNAKKGVFWRKEGVKTGFYPVKNGKKPYFLPPSRESYLFESQKRLGAKSYWERKKEKLKSSKK